MTKLSSLPSNSFPFYVCFSPFRRPVSLFLFIPSPAVQSNGKIGEPVKYTEFYNDIISEKLLTRSELISNYTNWKSQSAKFFFLLIFRGRFFFFNFLFQSPLLP